MEEIQQSLENALKHLVWIMDEYSGFYGLAPAGNYELKFEWGDGVTEDKGWEFARRLQLATAGKYRWEKFFAWYFEIPEEKALELIPAENPLFGGESDVETV